MKLAHSICIVLFLLQSFVFGNPRNESSGIDRPNIVFFLVDDLGWQDTSVAFWKEKTAFQDHFRTPNVERLATQGIRFTNAYSCAVCSPTRTSIMTGQNAARHHVTNWTLFANKDQSGKTNRLLPPSNWNKGGLQPDQFTLAKAIKTAGYRTIHCGKAHWGANGTPGIDPCKLGFDVNIGGHAAGAPGSYQGNDNFGNRSDITNTNSPWAVPGLEKYHGTNTHLTDALAHEACIEIENSINQDQPFFLYMAPYSVHTPIQPHPRYIANYRGKKYPGTEIEIPEVEAMYASMVEGVDFALGEIWETLQRMNVAENTIVVFTSDNGGLSAHARGINPMGTGANTHCWPLREGKGSAYEGGIRVPLVVSWAQRNESNDFQKTFPIKAKSVSRSTVICEDYFPTLCRYAGVEQSVIEELKLDGSDITPDISGTSESAERPLFFHYPHVWGPVGEGYQPHSSMRLANLKLIHFYHSRRWELYDLENDIGEQRNIVFEDSEKTKKLIEQMKNGLKRLEAQFPVEVTERLSHELDSHDTVKPVASGETRSVAAGWQKGKSWLDQHNDINELVKKGNIDLVFMGDSITQSWGGPGRNVTATAPDIWGNYYSKRNAANFGISGDRTQHVLWRIQNGNFDGINPKVIVLLIGTNNLKDNSPEEIADGLQQVVLQLEERRQKAIILLMGILPRGELNDDALRAKIALINQMASKIADDKKTFFLDIGKNFLNENGNPKQSHFQADNVHLSKSGYDEWAQAIEPTLIKLLGE